MFRATLFVMGAALVGCGPQTAQNETSAAALIGDAASITQKPDGTFSVVCKNGTTEIDTAAQIQANQVCVPHAANPADPFDPASCAGPTLTRQQALGYVDLTDGVQDVKIGRFQVYRRWRQIYTNWPAGPWQTSGISDVSNTYAIYNGSSYSGYFYVDGTGLAKVPLQGEIHIDYDGNIPLIALYGDSASFVLSSVDPTVSFSVLDWDYTSSSAPAPIFSTSQTVYQSSGGSTATLPLTFAGHSLSFQTATATGSCVRLAYDGNESETDSDNNTWIKESQLVVFGTFSN